MIHFLFWAPRPIFSGAKTDAVSFREGLKITKSSQVPKMEVLYLIRLFRCWVSAYISLTEVSTSILGT